MKRTIKELRKENNLTQGQLADGLGVDMRTIRRWEYHQSKVPNTKRKFIAKYFNIDEQNIDF